MTARGGLRVGSGRKPILAPQEAYEIVMECERLLIRHVPEVSPCRPYALARASVDSIEIDERRAWLGTDGAEQILDDIEFALQEEQKITDVDQPANRFKILKRPYAKGLRQLIAAEVAATWSKKLGRPILGKTVFRYWKAHRALPQPSVDLIIDQF